MKTLTCLPVKPSMEYDKSDPTPPDSRSFMPGSWVKASERVFVVFCKARVSTATTL